MWQCSAGRHSTRSAYCTALCLPLPGAIPSLMVQLESHEDVERWQWLRYSRGLWIVHHRTADRSIATTKRGTAEFAIFRRRPTITDRGASQVKAARWRRGFLEFVHQNRCAACVDRYKRIQMWPRPGAVDRCRSPGIDSDARLLQQSLKRLGRVHRSAFVCLRFAIRADR